LFWFWFSSIFITNIDIIYCLKNKTILKLLKNYKNDYMKRPAHKKIKKEIEIKTPSIIEYKKRILLNSIEKKSSDMIISEFKKVVDDISYLSVYSAGKVENINLVEDMIILDKILSTIHHYLDYVPENYKNKAIKIYKYLEDLHDMINGLQIKQNLYNHQIEIKDIKYVIRDILDYVSN